MFDEWCWATPARSPEPVTEIKSRIIRYISSIYLREPWWAEFWSGTIAIGWALSFAISGESLTISSPHTFEALEKVAPGDVWAWYCLIAGSIQIVVLLLDMRCARWLCAIIMSWFPCMAVTSMLMSTDLVPHIAVYGGWAGINLFSIFRLLRRAT
jgi:hypothetical protein